MPEGTETGIKWWMRYVIVPLAGGGTLVTLIAAAVISHYKTDPHKDNGSVHGGVVTSSGGTDNKTGSGKSDGSRPPDQPQKPTRIQFESYSTRHTLTGAAEPLAPVRNRPLKSGEGVVIQWNVEPVMTDLRLVIVGDSGNKQTRDIESRGTTTLNPRESAVYSLVHANDPPFASFRLVVE